MGLADSIRKESGARVAIRLCSAAYDYVVDEIHSVPSIGVMFWMTFKEMLDNKVADYEDKAILLCSLFRALGAEASVAIAEFSNGSNRPLIFVGRGESVVLCDPNEKHGFMDFVGRRESVLKRYRVGGESVKRLVYEFSDTEYTDHSRET
jgi:hypothetical protein